MALQAFSFPLPETRYIRAGRITYKFKIRGSSSSFRREEVMGGHCFNQEMEKIIRTVLGNLHNLQPFSSAHFHVFPSDKRRWEGASKMMCKHGERKLRVYPFSLILYLEKNTQNEEAKRAAEKLSPLNRCRSDSPLEEAIIKDLLKDMEAEGKSSVGGRLSLHCPHADRKVKEDPGHVDKKGSRGFERLQQKSGVNTVTGSEGEVNPGTTQSMGEYEREEDDDEEGENVPGTPVKPGILTRLASHVFPFSLFFRET